MSGWLWLAAAAVGHAALWVEIVNRSHGLIAHRPLSKAATALCGLALLGLPAYAASRGVLTDPWSGPEWLARYAQACVVIAIVAAAARLALRFDPLRLPAPGGEAEVVDLGERLGDAAMGSPALAWAARLPGNRLLAPRLERRELRLPRLPVDADGLRVAHLTDLHLSGRIASAYFEEVVALTNAFEPDLVCLTGDVVERPAQMAWVEPLLGGVRARLGRFFVLGNHDVKIDAAELRRRLTAIGWGDAGRERFRLGPEAGGAVVCGDERPWFPAGLGPADGDAFTVALVHTPDRFAWAASRGVDLVLAGHNHGGQVCFPPLGPVLCPSRHGVRFVDGAFRRGRTVMHVSRGTGSLFPLRYACPPELGLFTLRREDA